MKREADFIVEARGVRKTYRGGDVPVEALRGVDFAVRRGEMVAIMGPSGCGKTTLLNCLSGIDNIDGGEILVDGQSLQRLSDKALTRYRARAMGFVFQSFNLLSVFSAVENVEMPLLVVGVPPAEARARSLAALAAVGLADRATQRPPRLSGGQQQRVAVARAIVASPAIVWADEPTGNLDSETAGELMALLRRLNESGGQTFVVVTHARDVGELTDRIVLMKDGQIVPQPSAPTARQSLEATAERTGPPASDFGLRTSDPV